MTEKRNWAEGSGSTWEDPDGDPRIVAGAEVLVGEHRAVNARRNWAGAAMAGYVGTRQTVAGYQEGHDRAECAVCSLLGNSHRWRVRDLVCLRTADGELTEEGRLLEGMRGNEALTVTKATTPDELRTFEWAARAGIMAQGRDDGASGKCWWYIRAKRLDMALGGACTETRPSYGSTACDGHPVESPPEPKKKVAEVLLEGSRVYLYKGVAVVQGREGLRRYEGSTQWNGRVRLNQDGRYLTLIETPVDVLERAVDPYALSPGLSGYTRAKLDAVRTGASPVEIKVEASASGEFSPEVLREDMVKIPSWADEPGYVLGVPVPLRTKAARIRTMKDGTNHVSFDGGPFVSIAREEASTGPNHGGPDGVRFYEHQLDAGEVNAIYRWDAQILPRLKAYFDAACLTGTPDPVEVLRSLARCVLTGTTDLGQRNQLELWLASADPSVDWDRLAEVCRSKHGADVWRGLVTVPSFEPTPRVVAIADVELARLAALCAPAKSACEDQTGEQYNADLEHWLRSPCGARR